jgi:hypothetical protein
MNREEEIKTIAYYIWEEEGCCNGHDLDYWLKAEIIWQEKNQIEVPKPAVTEIKVQQAERINNVPEPESTVLKPGQPGNAGGKKSRAGIKPNNLLKP